MPRLLLKFNAAVIKEIQIGADSLAVGRKADNDIVIDNPAVSGHHCRISMQGGAYFVEDIESTNGTFVNGKRVKKSGLHNNDVVGLAKHALVFLEDAPPSAPAPQPTGKDRAGWLRVLKGVVGAAEYELKGMSTYIGKSDRVQVTIKGSGLFGSAPEVAASIHRKPEGFVLVAVTDGYPVVNGSKVSGSVLLNEGDLIECGATTMQFELRDSA